MYNVIDDKGNRMANKDKRLLKMDFLEKMIDHLYAMNKISKDKKEFFVSFFKGQYEDS